MTNTDFQALLIVRCHLDFLLKQKKITKKQHDGVLRSLRIKPGV